MTASAEALNAYATASAAIASALIEVEAMKVANAERERQDKAFAYDEKAFRTVQEYMEAQVRSQLQWVR